MLNRRKFLEKITLFLAALVGIVLSIPMLGHFVAPAFQSRQNKWFELMSIDDLPPPGEPEPINFSVNRISGWLNIKERRTAFVITTIAEDGNLHLTTVLSNVCSHLGCNVRWNASIKQFRCPCHDGAFSRDGTNLAGPPPRPLSKLNHKIKGDKIFIETEI